MRVPAGIKHWFHNALHSRLGVTSAFGAALLFGAGTPAAKLLLGPVNPWLLAGLLYLGSGIGLAAMRLVRHVNLPRMTLEQLGWLAGSILLGGVLGPVLLMWALVAMPASEASLLLNAEGVLTALLAWFVFRENFDRRIALGMGFIVAGAVTLSWPGDISFGEVMPSLAVIGACLCWAIDNNLTRKVSLLDASFIAMTKGLVAGLINTALAIAVGEALPSVLVALAAGGVGFLSYGLSLTLFVVALRHLGTARAGAYFSTAPFAGTLLGIFVIGEPVTVQLLLAGTLMGAGVWLHLSERHAHRHGHDVVEHVHSHEHDSHHQHDHRDTPAPETSHEHRHRHEPLTHTHVHFPDAHHRHDH